MHSLTLISQAFPGKWSKFLMKTMIGTLGPFTSRARGVFSNKIVALVAEGLEAFSK